MSFDITAIMCYNNQDMTKLKGCCGMSEIKDILENILSDEKLLNSKAFRDRVYSDVPIIRTAAQLIKPSTPQRIREMKAAALTPEAYWKTSAWLFCRQGRMMADYEDDFEYTGSFVQYYPTYRDLATEQLRGYFSWRTAVRKGDIKSAPDPFPFIYVYELLNGIGAEHGEENFRRIDSFCRSYGAFSEKFLSYRSKWLYDYAIYNDLDSSLLENSGDYANEQHIITLMHWDGHSADELYEAICAMSSYKTEQSGFAQENPDLFRTVLCRSYVLMSEFFRDHRKSPFWSRLFGKVTESSYRLFDTAVFYDNSPIQSREYTVNEIHSYICRSGRWTCRRLLSSRHRSAKLGEFVKAVDAVMRNEYGYPHKLSSAEVSKQEQLLIKSAISESRAEQKKAEAMKIEIDISKLGAIRKAADETREKLLVDEDEPEDIVIEEIAEDSVPDESSPLPEAETAFVSALLSGGDYDSAARKYGSMTSILADSVNEKLFDTFGDTVIIFEGDVPVVIEDYSDDLKEIIKEK